MNTNNFKSYLQAIMGSDYNVVNERDIDFDTENGKTNAIINVEAGNNFEKTSNYPFIINVYTTDIDAQMLALNTMVETYRNVRWTIGNNNVINAFQSPFVYDPRIEIGNEIYSRIMISGSFLSMESPLDLLYITVDGVDYKPLSTNLTATTECKTAAETGAYASEAVCKYQEETNTIAIYSYNDVFCNKLLKIKHGLINPNTKFSVVFHYTSLDVSKTCLVINPCFIKESYTNLPKWQFDFKTASNIL